MVQFKYDEIMKRYNVLVPCTLAGETTQVAIASISEDDKLTLHREVGISLVRQILMHWDEYQHNIAMEDYSMGIGFTHKDTKHEGDR